jgi:regulator of protease activity HflC (stomatin/prohibitin superfamily)
MSDTAESPTTRLWRDRVQLREQERGEAQRRATLAEEKVTLLSAENDRLARENACLSEQNNRLAVEVARLSAQNERLAADVVGLLALRAAEATRFVSETEQQMKDLKTALLALLDQASGSSLH